MNDEEFVQTQDPVIEIPPDVVPEPSTVPEPVPTAPPMEVVPVEDLLDRIQDLLGEDNAPEDSEELTEAPTEELWEMIEASDGGVDLPAADPATAVVEQIVEHLLDMIIDLGKIEEHTKEIREDMETVAQTLDHPALTTPFEEYTVTEALLLLLLLFAFVSACARMLRGGFSWLRS